MGAATPTTRETGCLQKVHFLPAVVEVLVAQVRQIVWLHGRILRVSIYGRTSVDTFTHGEIWVLAYTQSAIACLQTVQIWGVVG